MTSKSPVCKSSSTAIREASPEFSQEYLQLLHSGATMNDSGLGKPIQQHANDVERILQERVGGHERSSGLKKLRKVSRDNRKEEADLGEGLREELMNDDGGDDVQDAFLQPSRWWLTSTAFPLIAGAFGPLANLASVCALVQTWRVHIPPGGTEIHAERVPDPPWLIGINAVSLVFAVIANVFILMTFAQRIRYQMSLPVTITLWYIASFLLIALVAAASHRLKEHSGRSYAFSQSYYYGLEAAVLYSIIATLLLANYFNSTIKKHYRPSFNLLTIPQRTLMLQTTSLMFYVGISALVFSRIEGWEYADTVYWADYTILTIGLGTDYPLKKSASRALLIPYAIGGIIMLGLVVGSVRSLVLERAKIKMSRRAVEKERRRWIKILESSKNITDRGSRSANEVIKEDFEIMRKIQKNAEVKGKWTSLATSLVAILIVWLGGAMVFTFSERKQHWNYFDSLFFSYTSLLTIGYGDFYPQSNSGKPFFVIWSVIAVPAMTILISNMGDTVVVFFREATLWIGRKTILPEGPSESQSDRSETTKKVVEEVREALERPQKEVQRNLASEIKRVVKHVGIVPQKQYTFDEWIEFLELLGLELEDNNWSWLSDEGPLMSGLSEPEWLLERLCAKLEEALEN